MAKEAIIHTVQQATEKILSDNPAHFLVDIKIKPTNNIKVFIDGDAGVGIDELVKYNRSLYKILEEKSLFPDGDFSLEVSSPGLGEPLKLHRQYIKNTGRDVEITLADNQKIEGKILSVTDEEIIVEETKGKGKKIEIKQHTVPFSGIKATYVCIKF